MDDARPPTSDLHGGLVGLLVAGLAAWLALTGTLVDWAWDGQLSVAGLPSSPVGRAGALFLAASLAGLAAGGVAALLGIVKRRRARLSVLTGIAAGQGAALCVGAAFLAYASLAGGIATALLPLTLGGAAFVAFAVTGAVLVLVPRRE